MRHSGHSSSESCPPGEEGGGAIEAGITGGGGGDGGGDGIDGSATERLLPGNTLGSERRSRRRLAPGQGGGSAEPSVILQHQPLQIRK